MTIYRGVSGVNREVKKQFRGVGGVNREIKEQYRGVGGVNRKVFSSSPPGALYWEGDQCTALTGGWSVTYTYHANSVPVLESSYMIGAYAAYGWDTKVGYRSTVNPINVTPYSKLWYEVSIDPTVENGEAGYILLTKWNSSVIELDGGVVVQMNLLNPSFSAGVRMVGYMDLTTTNISVFPVFKPYRHLKLHKLWLE